jgi:hypothetical protein
MFQRQEDNTQRDPVVHKIEEVALDSLVSFIYSRKPII